MTGDGLILYVDDDKSNRAVFKQFSDEFDLRIVDSGAAALATLEHAPVAVVVTDQRMPEMTGIELLARVKALYPAVMRIVLTAYPDMNPALRAVNEQLVHRYILKPWDEQQLRETMRWALATFRISGESALLNRVVESERLIMLGTLHRMLVHELRAPVAYVRYNVQRLWQLQEGVTELAALLERHGDELPSGALAQLSALSVELPEMVKDMMTGTKALSELLVQTQNLVHRTKEKAAPVSDPMAAIRFAISYGKFVVHPAPRAKVYYDGPGALASVAMGSTELLEVLLNLVGNASHAVADRKVAGGEVRVVAREIERDLELTISDNGPGMDAETLRQIGTPFFSLRQGGSGLGIAQCHRLLGDVHGKLEFSSEMGRGTVASVSIPRA